ncbi:hypothetical protein [Mycobacteroides abscessus]|uniref:hypothetical protein n=1 Tax=Mycobacteroides abscessus TaxID=36809 RepID=UPI0009A83AF6|nr:hypothetical protein [Mycobacteroides abscessus]MDB2213912.1 hypothetical protein [Mycobacteroides abscessus subsp. massiliense]WJJ55509.1 hypothetical protein PROPHIT492_105 [Mycobacterium phage prophiT49-2]SLH91616.1 Uncharacterised protein [Mycobacteroides abscessus subsp. massiliense]SLI31403.1 Uncharacterised protein [Mycobacteroides abscessus subsp. massiliense]
MSDVDVMAAIIEKHGRTNFKNAQVVSGLYRISPLSAKEAAEALVKAGFGATTKSANKAQNASLDELERRLARLEGWAGLPQ